ncbi:hypothetical protein EROM_060200 [Encephalitozoon romaleae SJ-2008]|uniref:C3H1-type domain-containing protein n=1 Tax=Encephalitozoon romaleae (strain SJ-2008) TaxID=1178016 RepID=I7AEL4_ENCRO|nr:hypothetical protein EROM_060200 [Encephalitozoon romaleae SJ-2008]AFN83115.1 hypothetical protein EROM_060200 [Encephalitozoon romaleae SJ-2008]
MDDCYFFLYSSCKFKDRCTYRHNEGCRNNLVTCKNWESKIPCSEDCPYRHSKFHLKKNRREEMCYWEDKPGGCTKDRCEYRHTDPTKDAWKTRASSEEPARLRPSISPSLGSEGHHISEDTRLKDYEEVMSIQDKPTGSKDSASASKEFAEEENKEDQDSHENSVLPKKDEDIDIPSKIELKNNVLERSPSENTQEPQNKRVKTEDPLDTISKTVVNLEELDKEIEELDSILMK